MWDKNRGTPRTLTNRNRRIHLNLKKKNCFHHHNNNNNDNNNNNNDNNNKNDNNNNNSEAAAKNSLQLDEVQAEEKKRD